MSLSSGTTLISPTATVRTQSQHPVRRSSVHSTHHAAGSHHVKRRPSTHAQASHNHGHVAGHAGSSRRSSEGEHGRRAMVAGLTMHTLDPSKPKRKGSGDRPLTKSSRSDTHLPRLSRQTSNTSNVSHTSRMSHVSRSRRPRASSRKRSGESVELDAEGQETGTVDPDEEDWESGGEASGSKSKARAEDPMSAAMRRTVSDTMAIADASTRTLDQAILIDSPQPLPADKQPAPITQRTTGFAGVVHTPDPGAQTPAHALNDPTHVMPAHQIKHQQSVRSLHALVTAEGGGDGVRKPLGPPRGAAARTESPGRPARTASERSEGVQSTEGTTALPDTVSAATNEASKSPSFPFPNIPPTQEAKEAEPLMPTPPASTESIGPRSRQVSGKPSIRHRPSNSSLRSNQSFRAPPHPLNSPTGYRTGIAGTAGATLTSPMMDKRGPSMHHPPIAPPVVYRELATGQGWETPEDPEADQRPSRPVDVNGAAKMPRASSFSSARSFKGIFTPSWNDGSPSSTANPQPPTPSRRRTALELASAASKLQSTNDPVQYHHSLGHSSTVAETVHLISRFLPLKKIRRPVWEVTSQYTPEGYVPIGLTNGDYREAHESLIRTMRSMGLEGQGSGVGGRRTMSRSASQGYGHGLLTLSSYPNGPISSVFGTEESTGVGVVKGRNGPIFVSRGGWRGKTPFELSVERVLAQRPQRPLSGT